MWTQWKSVVCLELMLLPVGVFVEAFTIGRKNLFVKAFLLPNDFFLGIHLHRNFTQACRDVQVSYAQFPGGYKIGALARRGLKLEGNAIIVTL